MISLILIFAALEGKDTGEVNKKGKFKQEKRKQVTRSKRKQVIRETHI